MPRDHLIVIGDRDPLRWILTEQMMAFPGYRAREIAAVSEGHRFFLYTTRGCFHSPVADRGRVIGEAIVKSPVKELDEAVVFGSRNFPLGCQISITGLAQWREGAPMSELVSSLHLFDGKSLTNWGNKLRTALVSLDAHDASLIHRSIKPVMGRPEATKSSYLL